MLYLKKIKKYYLNFFIWFLISIFVLTILSYFNIISTNILKIFKIVIPIIIIIINSCNSAKITKIKGYLNGIIYASLITITLFLINIIFFRIFFIKQSIYYIILIISATLGSMIGKTKKSQLNN